MRRAPATRGSLLPVSGLAAIASGRTDDNRCVSTLNVAYRGSAPVQKDASKFEEVEGVTIWKDVSHDGQPTQVHVILLDNDWPDGDDIYFKHYQVPTAQTV
ncbi:hypothetical protein [Ornithinimicrobium sp. W1665]|uniref:hypothetical protein n=1 Tax=Ornithinimicrobium sp. W1665 TaxID=3416666 RepID=UPI003CFAD80F